MLSWPELTAVAAGGGAAGFVNAVAGGGSLVSFPILVAVGLPTVRANVTNTVALCPGYLAAAVGQRADRQDLDRRARRLVITSAAGGLVGSLLLVVSSEDLFDGIVPFLVVLACALLATQPAIRRAIVRRAETHARDDGGWGAATVAAGLAGVYGGYFGAGLGIMLLAVLGIFLEESLHRLNALKQVLSLGVNVTAAAFFAVAGDVAWDAAAAMALAAILGGHAGARVASRLPTGVLRAAIVTYGLIVAVALWVRR